MGEVIPIGAVLLLGGTGFLLSQRGFSRQESLLLFGSFVAHIVSTFAQVWIIRGVYGGGDILGYYANGLNISLALKIDFAGIAPEVARILLHQDADLPFRVGGAGGPTGTMCALAGFLLFLTDDSLYAASMIVSVTAYFGKVALYRSLRDGFAARYRHRLLVAAALVPSVVFWSSALLKESVAIGALGWLFLSSFRLVRGAWRWYDVLVVVVSTVVVLLVKAYIVFAFVPAIAVAFYWQKAVRAGTGEVKLRPAYLVLGGMLAVAGVVLLGSLFPEYSVERFGEEAARNQRLGAVVRGASTYEIGDASERSLTGQLAYAPVALLSSLFRPFIFEVHNAQMAVNALETTAIAVLFVRAVALQSWRRVWRKVKSSPTMMFCLVFIITLGVAVGLNTTNLGTLSRYRMPLVPFLVVLVLVWNASDAALALRAVSRTKALRVSPHGPSRR